MRSTLIIIASFFSSLTNAQTVSKEKIIGEYKYSDSTFNAGMHSYLTLLKSGVYKYESGTHLQVYHSQGTWKLKGDTLILNSFINAQNIPITLRAKKVDSIKDEIVFGLVKNLDGEIMNASLFFDNDTTKSCDPLMEKGCTRKVSSSIKSFKVQFNGNASTKWYKLKRGKANLIEITANVHDVLALYLFFENEKYVLRNGSLRYILKDDMVNEKAEELKKIR